jgi:hypothetical protein
MLYSGVFGSGTVQSKGTGMSTDAEEPARTLYRPLPEISEAPGAAIASSATEVDALLEAVLERMQGLPSVEEQMGYYAKRVQLDDDPAWRFDCKKKLLAALLREGGDLQLPNALLPLLMRVAVYEPNPSFNRGFIDPCLQTYGAHRVLDALLGYLATGSNREKAGAARAFYWARRPLLAPQCHARAVEDGQEEDLAELRGIIATRMLQEFIANDDLDVRRSLIAQLSFDPARYPDRYKPLIATAIAIARDHPDDYIRHRLEIQIR